MRFLIAFHLGGNHLMKADMARELKECSEDLRKLVAGIMAIKNMIELGHNIVTEMCAIAEKYDKKGKRRTRKEEGG
jgi:hypothetical protein